MLHRVLVEDFKGEASTMILKDRYNEKYPSMSVTTNEIGQLLSRYPYHFQKIADGNRTNGRVAMWAAVIQ